MKPGFDQLKFGGKTTCTPMPDADMFTLHCNVVALLLLTSIYLLQPQQKTACPKAICWPGAGKALQAFSKDIGEGAKASNQRQSSGVSECGCLVWSTNICSTLVKYRIDDVNKFHFETQQGSIYTQIREIGNIRLAL